MVNEKLNSLKIGIGGELARENRIDDHARQGWLLYKKLTLEKAEDIYDLEQKTLKWLREDMGYPPHLSKEQMPQSGWTETVDADLISVPADTPHWFDMGVRPAFVAIRFFNNQEGWVAHYSGNPIAEQFSRLET